MSFTSIFSIISFTTSVTKTIGQVEVINNNSYFIHRDDFLLEEHLKSKLNQVDYKILAFIYGDHFIKAQTGDTLPSGIYMSKDGKSCYIIDKKSDESTIKTTYNISENGYEIIFTETL